jgi:hypothetical protein
MKTRDDVITEFTVPDDVEGYVAYLDTYAMADRILQLETDLVWIRDLVRMAYYEGAEDNDFNRELEFVDYELGRTPYTKLPERKYTWNTSNVKRLLDG